MNVGVGAMHTDEEVLLALGQRLSTDELADTLARLLRIPEAWRELHTPELLERLVSNPIPDGLTPWDLGSLALVGSYAIEPGSPLPDDLEARLRTLTDSQPESVPARDFKDAALLGVSLARLEGDGSIADDVVGLVLVEPASWSTPLSVAFSRLASSEVVIQGLLDDPRDSAHTAAIKALLANLGLPDAAQTLVGFMPSARSEFVDHLRKTGQLEILRRFLVAGVDERTHRSAPRNTPEAFMAAALRQLAEDDRERAQRTLETAWDMASDRKARVAELMAEAAKQIDDTVLALEARRQALGESPSPARKAWYALALLDADQPDEALNSLDPDGGSWEERIAAGMALRQLDRSDQAAERLCAAADDLANSDMDDRWLEVLLRGLLDVEEIEQAVKVATARVDLNPASYERRLELARVLFGAGDPLEASRSARLAHALAPGSSASRHTLAIALQNAGQAAEALTIWKTEANSSSKYLSETAMCALDAGMHEFATAAARRLIETDPRSAVGRVILGKSLAAAGHLETALRQLEEATRIDPTDSEAWVTLAQYQAQNGGPAAAIQVLESALGSTPQEASLLVARARWLQADGRLSEALESARVAAKVQPTAFEPLFTYGELLSSLGHHPKAVEVLEIARRKAPRRWRVRHALARAYEAQGDLGRAAQVLAQTPVNALPSEDFDAGRILIKGYLSGETPSGLERGLRSLGNAEAKGFGDRRLDYWIAKAFEAEGKAEEALRRFQTFLHASPSPEGKHHSDAILGMARSALRIGKPSVALSVLEGAQSHLPEGLETLSLIARAYLESDLPEKALGTAGRALKIDPRNGDILRMVVRAAERSGSRAKALQALQRLVEVDPSDENAWFDLARTAIDTAQTDLARKSVAQALRFKRKDPEVLRKAAAILDRLDLPEQALRLLKAATKFQPDDATLFAELATFGERLGELDLAQSAWRRCAGLEPLNHHALCREAEALWKLSRRSEAIDSWFRALELDPQNVDLHKTIARSLVVNGEVQKGLNQYAQIAEQHPQDATLAIEAGESAMVHGASLEALEWFNRAVDLAPDDPRAHLLTAEALVRLQRWGEALHRLQRATALGERSAKVHALTSLASLEMDDLATAESSVDACDEIPPSGDEGSVWLARASVRLGRWKQALDTIRAALETIRDPNRRADLLDLWVRIFEADWVFRAAAARSHAPEPSLVDEASRAALESQLEMLDSYDLSPTIRDGFHLRAKVFLREGEVDVAEDQIASDDRRLPPNLLEGVALAMLRLGYPERALSLLEEANDLGSDGAWGQLIRGLCNESLAEYPHARRAFGAATHDPAFRPLANFLIGRLHAAEGRTEEAVASISLALADWPEEASWHIELAQIYREQSDPDIALPHLRRAAELEPEKAETAIELARTLEDTGHHKEATEVYARTLDIIEATGPLLKEAGLVALSAGDERRAGAWLDQACEHMPSDSHALIAGAQAALLSGDRKKANDHAQAAMRFGREDPQVLLGYGEVLAQLGRLEEALQVFDAALARSADPRPIHIARCRLLLRSGQQALAVEGLKRIIAENPDDDAAWATLADASLCDQDLTTALEAATRAVRLAPAQADHRMRLGVICRQAGQLDRALDELVQAQALNPGDAVIHLELSRVFRDRRDHQRALEALERAIEIDPRCTQAYFEAGSILKELKAYRQAGRMFKRAIELNPQDGQALHQLAAVRALELVHGGIPQGTVTP